MITFVHTADIHFGVENYGRIDPKTGIHTRLLDFESALNFCIDVAIERNVDFFLFAGDAYKTAHPSPTQQRLLLQCLLRLYKAGIPVIIIVGNHDNPFSFGKAHALDVYQQLPVEGFHVIAKPTSVCLATRNGPVQIVGIPWPSRAALTLNARHTADSATITQEISAAVSFTIRDLASQLDANIPAVLAGHLTVSTGVFSGSEKRAVYGTDPLFLPSQLAIEPFDYVGLGHLHRYQNLNADGYPAVVYAGSLERVDFGERNEEKGFCVVSIPEKGRATHEFIKTPTRPFVQIDVYLTVSTKSQTDQIIDALAQQTITDAVVKIVYYLSDGMQDRVDSIALQKACAAAWYVVGIFPVRKAVVRERRMVTTFDMEVSRLLEMHFAAKSLSAGQRQELIKKALVLYEALDEEKENNS